MLDKTNGGFLVTMVKQFQGRVFARLLVDHGISQFNGAQGRILFVLWNEDGIPVTELSARTGLAKTTLTSMLDRMEAAGHVQRIADGNDRRKVRIQLTSVARTLRSQYESVSKQMSEVFYHGFSDDEIIAFERSLTRIVDNLTVKENE
ncbi:MAG: MarR family transcriptional regulator [Propionibacteriaceae bacterium]|nr:MarR family transcriptional regulator [Propionibacteriaceae bacterium]